MISVKLEGVPQAIEKLKGIRDSTQRQILRAGIMAACQFGAKHGKGYVPVGKTKMLRKAMGYKVLRNRSGQIKSAGIVGARNMPRNGVNPAKYAHLVDEGTKPHVINPKRARRLAFHSGGRLRVVPGVRHPGSRAQHFMRRILSSGQSGMSSAFTNRVEVELHKAAAKGRL